MTQARVAIVYTRTNSWLPWYENPNSISVNCHFISSITVSKMIVTFHTYTHFLTVTQLLNTIIYGSQWESKILFAEIEDCPTCLRELARTYECCIREIRFDRTMS